MANIMVIGALDDQEHGLTESLAAFDKNNRETVDALMNISGVGTPEGKKVHHATPRQPYVVQPFPAMLYKPGEEITVQNANEMADAQRRGYRTEPYIKPQVELLDPAQEKKNLMETNKQLQAQQIVQAEEMAKLMKRLEELEGTGKKNKAA